MSHSPSTSSAMHSDNSITMALDKNNNANDNTTQDNDHDMNNDNNNNNNNHNTIETQIKQHVLDIQSNKLSTQCMKQIISTLNSVQKSLPVKVRADNIAFQKFVLKVQGGKEILLLAGFNDIHKQENNKDVHYYICDKPSQHYDTVKQAIEHANTQTNATSTTSSATQSTTTTPTKPTATSNPPRQLCLNKCGFYGDLQYDGYCSQCYRLKQTGSLKVDSKKCMECHTNFGSEKLGGRCSECHKKLEKYKKSWRYRLRIVKHKLHAAYVLNLGKKPVQENKSRCYKCGRKVGITGFECRCHYVFCSEHRYAEAHDCMYDYKSAHRQNLRKANEQIVGKKIDKV